MSRLDTLKAKLRVAEVNLCINVALDQPAWVTEDQLLEVKKSIGA